MENTKDKSFFEFAKSKIAVTCKSIQGKDYIIVILSGKELNIPIDLIVNLEKVYSPVFINRVNEHILPNSHSL